MSSAEIPFFVLSGGPCSGKTSTVEALARRGQTVLGEAATELIRAAGSQNVRSDPLKFQKLVLERQVTNEAGLLESPRDIELVFLDRGVGDGIGYLRHHGLPLFPEILSAWEEAAPRYRAILFFDQNPEYEDASHRSETPEVARQIHETLREEYEARHANVIRIPWISIEERADRVIDEARRLL